MKKILISLIALLAIGLSTFAQTDYPYFPDRPGVTANARLVGLHQASYETSIGYNYIQSNDFFTHNLFSQTNQFRLGAWEHLELRLGFNMVGYQYSDGSTVIGSSGLSVGAKIPIVTNEKNCPDIGVLLNVNLPGIGDNDFTLQNYLPSYTLLLQKAYGKFTLMGNLGVAYDVQTKNGYYYMYPATAYVPDSNDTYRIVSSTSLAVYYALSPKWGVFGEGYGYFADSCVPFWGVDAGFSYLITPELQWDISGGVACNVGLGNSFVNTGIAWRIPNKYK